MLLEPRRVSSQKALGFAVRMAERDKQRANKVAQQVRRVEALNTAASLKVC